MQANSAHPADADGGSVGALWRYPAKSMLGEELNAAEITPRGLLGDRQFAVVDAATGKVADAKNPRKWGNFLDFRAAYVEPPQPGSELPAVRVTLTNGTSLTSRQADLPKILSAALGREVTFAEAQQAGDSPGTTAEEYWPDVEGLELNDAVTDFDLPAGTFFDVAVVHLLTTATMYRLRVLHPEGRFEVRRFRPTSSSRPAPDAQGFPEDRWIGHTVSIGDHVRLRITGACSRCVMTTLPQGDLPKDSGILRTAAQHNDVNVGVYADVIAGGPIRRSDPVIIRHCA
jgi:uncharacterized protein